VKYPVALVASLIIGCANQPDRPTEYVSPDGEGWIISTVSSEVSGAIHLMINGERVATGSFGVFFGNKASGRGRYRGREVAFHCVHRVTPDCFVYVDGKLVTKTKFHAGKEQD